jgi:hypothetical protein
MPSVAAVSRASSTGRAAPAASSSAIKLAKFTRSPAAISGARMLERAVKEAGLASSVMSVVANATTKVVEKMTDKDIPGFKQVLHVKVAQAPKNGVLDVTVLICVSGHTDQEKEFARTNTYTITVTLPNGKSKTFNGLKRSKSVEYVSAFDIQIPLMKGKTTIVASPEGTSSYGYSEGRTNTIEY